MLFRSRAFAHFFDHADMAVEFKGRAFTREEERLMAETIQDAAKIQILCIIEKDTCTAKHIVETVGKEYPVAGAFSDIQIADAAIEKCWEWIETKNFAVLDDFEKIVDGGDWHADLVQIQWDAPEQEQGIWACVINCVCYCYRIVMEKFYDDGIVIQFLEICDERLYGWMLDDYSKINPAYAREIDEIEKFFVANYSEGSEKKVCKEDVKRFYEN